MTDIASPESTSQLLDRLWPVLVAEVPDILASQDPDTGRFGTQPFIVNDQNLLWPLAVAWATPGTDARPNPYHGDHAVLAAIIAGGDALIEVADERGRWEFRKKDNSTWGPIHMPWTYSRWIRAWALVRDAMPADRRAAWDAAITLGVDDIVATDLTLPIRNIPAHHAMGVYRASQVLGREDWREAAVDYLHRVVADQDPAGFWSEHHGPVVMYNVVYVDALGCYHGMSGDPVVLDALERAATFHASLTYPDASQVETVDERNPYGRSPAGVSVGFLADPVGRGYLTWLLDRRDELGAPSVPADTIASMVSYGADGPQLPPPAGTGQHSLVLGAGDARVERQAPWFVALSAYHSEPPAGNRWIQDRQAHLSLFHDRVGVVISGSNTRMQPRWSTVTAGDVTLLSHVQGDEEPDFAAPAGLRHIPTGARLASDGLGVDLTLDDLTASVRVALEDDAARVRYVLETPSYLPVVAHAALIAHPGEAWSTGGPSGTLGQDPVRRTGAECGGWFGHHGWRVTLPDDALVEWPVYGHNPYTKDGSAGFEHARIVVSLPLAAGAPSELVVEID